MTKREAMAYVHLVNQLTVYGVTQDEVNRLLRCERTLRRWAERECGDGSDWHIERDGENADGRPYMVYHGPGDSRRYPIADREAGALRTAARIAQAHGLTVYHQSDPRGCALYLLRPGDVPVWQRSNWYTRGIAVCL